MLKLKIYSFIVLIIVTLLALFWFQSPVEASSKCYDKKPSDTPRIIRMDAKPTQVKLYFTSVAENNTAYFIMYGYKAGDQRFGTYFPMKAGAGHSVKYFIYQLEPGATYSFTVRGGNGCRTGNWSDWKTITTPKKGITIKHF